MDDDDDDDYYYYYYYYECLVGGSRSQTDGQTGFASTRRELCVSSYRNSKVKGYYTAVIPNLGYEQGQLGVRERNRIMAGKGHYWAI
jgi:hypothetical protein